jgi:hypothetical protein
MSINRPCYVTRESVQRAMDLSGTILSQDRVDRAIEAASDKADGDLHRVFFNSVYTAKYDWPNYQRAYPWRIWFDASELADVTVNPPVVTTGGNVIPDSAVKFGPWNYAPPYTYMELDRSKNYSFGLGSTPQQDVQVQGTYGYWIKTEPAGALTASLSLNATTTTVSNSQVAGTGDVLQIGSGPVPEYCLVRDKQMVDTTVSYAGLTQNKASDNAVTVTDGTKFFAGELLQADTEQVIILSVTGNVLTVKRGFNGTVLAAHSGGTLYAQRQLTITRGDFGSTAASYISGQALNVTLIPSAVRDACAASALMQVQQETAGYAATAGSGGTSMRVTMDAVSAAWDKACTKFGRKLRVRVI